MDYIAPPRDALDCEAQAIYAAHGPRRADETVGPYVLRLIRVTLEKRPPEDMEIRRFLARTAFVFGAALGFLIGFIVAAKTGVTG